MVELQSEFLRDVLDGLGQNPKQLHCKYFYDERGSRLFDEICKLPEYYLTRTEQSIMDSHAAEMALQIGADAMLVEFGSGSSQKTRVLLDHLETPAAYVPLDISEEHLLQTAQDLKKSYPHIEILPLVADFTKSFQLPQSSRRPSHAAVYFPGSTIGNFTPVRAQGMLTTIASILGHDGGMLIGIDLQKDPEVIEAAYNDSRGVTEAFNLNLLHRVNRELGGQIDVSQFAHIAEYNQKHGRVEIYIESRANQTIQIGSRKFSFDRGERMFTEYSHKYTVDGFASLAEQAGFELHRHWTDSRNMFAVLHLVHSAPTLAM